MMPRAEDPAPTPRNVRVLIALMLVAGVLSAGFFTWRVYDSANDLTGERVLVVERSPDIIGAFQLDLNRTQTEAPRFAALLDTAWVGGKATTNDPEVVAEARGYLNLIAQENGHERFEDPPYENVFDWGEGEDRKTLRVLYFDDAGGNP